MAGTGGGARPVAVVGTGLTGASWAGLFAAHGLEVRLHDRDPDRAADAVTRAARAATFLVDNGLADPGSAETGRTLLRAVSGPEQAFAGVGLVQECVTEDLAAKRAVFALADRLAPADALIATSSSGMSISEIQEGLPGAHRMLAAHPYNPPHLVPLVELAPGRATAPRTMERAREFYATLGKQPVVLRRDIPGYIANRLSAALWREAVELVRAGVASVAEVDEAVRSGPGLRWSVMGPHLLYHLGGGPDGIRGHIAHLTHTKEGMLRDLASWTAFPGDTADVLERGVLEEAGGATIDELADRRDRALIAALRARRAVEGGPTDPSAAASDAPTEGAAAVHVARSEDHRPVQALPGVSRTTLAVGRHSMAVRFELDAGAEIPLHTHPHEQTGYLAAGDLTLLGGPASGDDRQTYTVAPGDAWSIPGGLPHGARTLAGAVVVEVFTPAREDYLPGPAGAAPDRRQ